MESRTIRRFLNKTADAPKPQKSQMKKKCPNCQLVNFATAENCRRCELNLLETSTFNQPEAKKSFLKSKLFLRAGGLFFALFIALFGFYMSLILSAKRLEYNEKKSVERAILILEDKGFDREVFLLRYLTAYRANDNWLNASTREENAYAATNFPFEIMTIYPDFFQYPRDDIERAAILLHEAQHLKGADEKEAYEFVWKNRQKLGWTKEIYRDSLVWRNVRKQTKEVSPDLFVCNVNEYGDCTE
jgi:ribosomal protein L40E